MEDKYKIIQGNNGCLFENFILYPSERGDFLIIMNKNTGEISVPLINRFKGKINFSVYCNDRMWCIEKNLRWIAEINIKEVSIVYHNLELNTNGKMIILVSAVDNKIYICRKEENELLVFDTINYSLNRINFSEYKKNIILSCVDNEKIYMFDYSNSFLIYDIKNGSFKSVHLNKEIKVDAVSAYNNMLLTRVKDCIYRIENGEVIKVCSLSNSGMGRICVTDDKIIVLPGIESNEIIIIDLQSFEMTKYVNYPTDFEYSIKKGWGKYFGYCQDENYFYWIMRASNYFMKIDKRSGDIEWIKPINIDFEMIIKEKYLNVNHIINEEICSIDSFIKVI